MADYTVEDLMQWEWLSKQAPQAQQKYEAPCGDPQHHEIGQPCPCTGEKQ